jgi:thiol-disulfide isomerase/thioredoxin
MVLMFMVFLFQYFYCFSTCFSNELTESCGQSGTAIAGRKAPWFSGWTVDNKVFNIKKPFEDPDVKLLAVSFFATWCVPCKKGIDMLCSGAEKLKQAGIYVVLVDVGEEELIVKKYVDEYKISLPVVVDKFEKAKEIYLQKVGEKVSIPKTIIIDREGKIKAIFCREGDDYLERVIKGE